MGNKLESNNINYSRMCFSVCLVPPPSIPLLWFHKFLFSHYIPNNIFSTKKYTRISLSREKIDFHIYSLSLYVYLLKRPNVLHSCRVRNTHGTFSAMKNTQVRITFSLFFFFLKVTRNKQEKHMCLVDLTLIRRKRKDQTAKPHGSLPFIRGCVQVAIFFSTKGYGSNFSVI